MVKIKQEWIGRKIVLQVTNGKLMPSGVLKAINGDHILVGDHGVELKYMINEIHWMGVA